MSLKDNIINELEKKLADFHDDTNHVFTPEKEGFATCKICGWINPQIGYGKLIRTYYEGVLKELKSLEIGKSMIVEINIIQKRPSFFRRLFGRD